MVRAEDGANFFEYLHQLVRAHCANSALTALGNKAFFIQPSPSLAFPIRDVDALEEDTDAIRLICNLMGLYGVDSPLPFYFNGICIHDNDAGKALRYFLNALNHRYYVLYFLAWRTFQPEKALEVGDSATLELMRALRRRSASPGHVQGVRALFHRFLPGIPMRCEQGIPHWNTIDRLDSLGSLSMVLGDNTLLGQRYLDASYGLCFEIGPLPQSVAVQLRQGGVLATLMRTLTARLPPGMAVTFNVVCSPTERDTCLGQSIASLGQTTALGRSLQPIVLQMNAQTR